jgi:anaerobic magnesium-protoporphyrin IX monomethyl ester cyclase
MSQPAHRIFLLTMRRTGRRVPTVPLRERVEALRDAGFAVDSVDLNDGPRSSAEMVARAREAGAQVFIIDAVDCPAAYAASLGLAMRIKAALPAIRLVYAGAYPCAHWREVLTGCAAIDLILRGEELRTLVWLARAIVTHGLVATVPGIAYRCDGQVLATRAAKPLRHQVLIRGGSRLANVMPRESFALPWIPAASLVQRGVPDGALVSPAR